jgi:hypothetical protein
MPWREGYHHGQIRPALKAMGRPMADEEVVRVTCRAWMREK